MNSETKAKHTPGPWTVKPIPNDVFGEPVEFHVIAGDMYVALCCDLGPQGQGYANARLIASAPELEAQRDELLAVCKMVAADLECYAEDPEYETRIGDPLRAAIARAERKE